MHKYNLGVVGNCGFMAYIDTNAAVRWMCMPAFDSSFLFGSLLDEEKGGCFRVNPSNGQYQSKQYYLTNTNVLCTEFTASDGSFRVVDFAPRFVQYDRNFKPLMLIRKLECLSGTPEIKVECSPRGDYGNIIPEEVPASNHIRYMNLGTQVRLTTDVPLPYITQKKSFVLTRNMYLVLTYGEPLEAPLVDTAERFLLHTIKYWELWVKSTYIPDVFQQKVIRSALILKLHQYEDTGGIIAAGTTSLPESPGSGRTWDYRYCWFRDTYYTLQAFNIIGHFEELERFFDFIQNILYKDKEDIQPLYTITAGKEIEEKILALDGYLGNKPVRIGNAAYQQVQYDIYGQVLITMLPLFFDYRLVVSKSSHVKFHALVSRLLNQIEKTLPLPDAGIWEFRNTMQHHCYTVLFHWAGAMAAYKFAATLGDEPMRLKAQTVINNASAIIEQCYSQEEKAFMQAVGSKNMDASTIKLITMNYLRPNDDRAKKHLEAIERTLQSSNGLVYRYRHPDDFGAPETTFLVCSFWYAEALACVGRVEDAYRHLETISAYSNHLGLFSEDVNEDGSQWGNFPQTYSHVGLINTAFRISRFLNKPHYFM